MSELMIPLLGKSSQRWMLITGSGPWFKGDVEALARVRPSICQRCA
jgi:hypothetical protein